MIYNQDDEENFLSDKKIGEKIPEDVPRRRGGAYSQSENKQVVNTRQEVEEYEEDTKVDKAVMIVAIIVALIAAFILFKVFTSPDKEEEKSDNNVKTENVSEDKDKSKGQAQNNKEDTTASNSNTKNDNTITNAGVNSSESDNYNTYDIKIESVVYKKGGNFYNNNEKIKGDKAYVEYKQISGLKDSKKQEQINTKLKEASISLYDKEYLSDKDTLFVDIHTKISVNFNTLSYIVYKTGEDIDGNRVGEKIVTLNIRLDTLEEITFEDLFTSNANINLMLSNYTKSKVKTFYYTPKEIYVYDDKLKETVIDMSKYASSIAIYTKYKTAENLFESGATTKKVFTINDTTVSDKTKDRAFTSNK